RVRRLRRDRPSDGRAARGHPRGGDVRRAVYALDSFPTPSPRARGGMMALTNVELYEALKGPVGEEAARLISETLPAARDLATKQDIAELHTRFGALDARLNRVEGQLRLLTVLFATFMGGILAGVFGIMAT